MHFAIIFGVAVLASTTVAQRFIHFDVEKRSPLPSARMLRSRAARSFNVPILQNPANKQEYIINVTVGTPGQRLGVTLDTGSSDLWLPSAKFCNSLQPSRKCDYGSFDPSTSSSYKSLEQGAFNISYAAPGDSDAGDWACDSVNFGGSSTVKGQIFGLSNNGYDVHGVMGLGYNTHETTAPNDEDSYPTVVDNMVTSGLINRRAYSLYLNSYNASFGSVIFGGVDPSKYTGPLVALPLQPGSDGGSPSEFFVTLSKVTFNDASGKSTVLTPDGYAQSVLLDSGTSFTGLTNDVVQRLTSGMGAVAVDSSGGLAVPCQYANSNATISYTFGGANGVTVSVPISQTVGLPFNGVCDFGVRSKLGGLAVLGDTFLRSAYAVFDIENNVAALAQAVQGQSGTASIIAIPTGTSIPGVTSTATATGTQLSGDAVTATPTVSVAATRRSTIYAGSPTFDLGAAATSGVATNAADMLATIDLFRAAMWGAGLFAAAFVL